MNFISKGRTLKTLKVKNAIIPKLYIFTVARYKRNRNIVLKDIKNYFNSHIAIRSSGLMEDTTTSSKAGKFKSILNIDSQNILSVDRAINQVISSYKNYENPNNEILIQTMVENVIFSGVAFSCDKDTAAPYFTINYTRTKNTFDITSGKVNAETFVMFKDSPVKPKSKFILKIINLIIELLKITKYDRLDIEFAIDKSKKIYLLQVRPLVINKSTKKVLNIEPYLRNINKKIKKLQKPHPDLFGKKSYFGVMPDWNPAEIIGLRPNPLAISLYQELITDHVWSISRKDFGYKDVTSNHLMSIFFGTPYIDVRIDFNSWIPKTLGTKLSEKLVNYYLKSYKTNPHLHDKVEFDILFTCFTIVTKDRIKVLKRNNFSKTEIKKILDGLKFVTENSVKQLNNLKVHLNILEKKFESIKRANMYFIDKIYWLIEDCKKYGTLPFAGFARCAFTSVDFLNSLLEKKIITNREKTLFLNSLNTIASDIKQDYSKFNKKRFLEKYGHLRPNTFDITSKSYFENYNYYFKNKKTNIYNPVKKFKFSESKIKKINYELKKNKINMNAKHLLEYIAESIKMREYSKFLFTKNLNLILELIMKLCKRNNISRNDCAYLDVGTILNLYYSLDYRNLKDIFHNKIATNKRIYSLNEMIKLPENIINNSDIYFYTVPDVKINFVGNTTVTANTIYLDKSIQKNLKNKIVIIDNADPGYDYLFTKGIKGLITKFGGVNSHMSIRCSELSIPAAIGIGEKNFSKINKAKLIRLDCKHEKLELVR